MNTKPVRKQLLDGLHWRYATKQFDPARKISAEDWAALEEALVLTPSSYGLQPWAFVVVDDPAVREKLVAASWGQRQVADASHLVVFAVKQQFGEPEIDAYLQKIAEVRGVPLSALAGFRDMMLGSIVRGMDDAARRTWATKQVYIALGNLLNSAALLEIDACPMEGIMPAKYDEILNLQAKGLSAIVVAALGYRAESDNYAKLPKVRFAKQEVLLHI
jgi:nitroreductase